MKTGRFPVSGPPTTLREMYREWRNSGADRLTAAALAFLDWGFSV